MHSLADHSKSRLFVCIRAWLVYPFALSREFEFVTAVDEITRIRDVEEAKTIAIDLLRLNRSYRESIAAMVKAEIPERFLPPS